MMEAHCKGVRKAQQAPAEHVHRVLVSRPIQTEPHREWPSKAGLSAASGLRLRRLRRRQPFAPAQTRVALGRAADETGNGHSPHRTSLHLGYCAAVFCHPHVHFLISAGGVTADGKSWREPKGKYLIPATLLSRAIAIEFRRRLEKKHPELFRQCAYATWHKPWNSFIKAYGEKEGAVLKYLSRYVFRIAITNARLVSMDQTHVTFRYKDHDTGEMRTCRLDGVEFLRRYLTHVLPRGFHKVRYYGLWHHSRRKQAGRAWLLLTLAKPAGDHGKITITELIEALSRSADEASVSMLGDSDISESRVATPRCPHCDSPSTVLVGEVAWQGSR